MKQKRLLLSLIAGFLIVAAVVGYLLSKPKTPSINNGTHKRVVINEAVRNLLYLPLYHAKERGFFADEGLDVEIITGGTATNSFAAMMSGEADFSQADPMYVPISREKGSRAQVVAQVVARIAVWGVTKDPNIQQITKDTLKGKTIATQPRPMTAYAYTIKMINDLGLLPEKDVRIIETRPPNEIIPFLNGQADYAMSIEPATSTTVSQGAHVVFSFPQLLGDQIFTGLMATEEYILKNPETVQAVVNAYQRALQDLHQNPQNGVTTAKAYLPQLDEAVLQLALKRLTDEKVFPRDTRVSEESWNRAIKVRVSVGDLKDSASASDCIVSSFAENAAKKYP